MLILAEICAKPAAAAEASRNVLHLGEENTMAACVLRIEDFDAAVIAICDVDAITGIDDEVVRQLKLTRTGSPLAPMQQILSVSRVFHHASVSIAIANVHIAI